VPIAGAPAPAAAAVAAAPRGSALPALSPLLPPPLPGPAEAAIPGRTAAALPLTARRVPAIPVQRAEAPRPELSGPTIYKVSELVGRAARLLEENFGDVWVEGEIEGFKRHHVSGNCYFALKDGAGRLECMLRRSQGSALAVPLRDGMKIRARGRVTLYREQGRFQFYIEEVELSGEGELLRQFEELKARLAKEGLFDTARKRPLPRFPRTIGIATSQSGAALHDILRVASRRGKVNFLIANCAVQGQQAPPQIAAAIARLAPLCEVIIVGRGGGSVADLWGFNDEQVARAIYLCPVPVVSAVGHEVDFTIADFVADVRAPTPSAAAELCVPELAKLAQECDELRGRLLRAGRRLIDSARQRLDGELHRGQLALERQVALRRRTLSQLAERLSSQHPRSQLLRDRAALSELARRLEVVARRHLETRRRSLEAAAGKLDAMSPLKVLHRGYAVARDRDGHVLTDAAAVPPGTRLRLQLAQGELACRVEEPPGTFSPAPPDLPSTVDPAPPESPQAPASPAASPSPKAARRARAKT
jgi:exodeoxyribonuclease VII large subunit